MWPIFERTEEEKRMASLYGRSMEQAQFNGMDSSLGTVGDTKLGEDVLDVDFDRAYHLIQLAYHGESLKNGYLQFIACFT